MDSIGFGSDAASPVAGRRTKRRGLPSGALLAAAGFLAVWGFSLSRNLFDPIGYDQALYQYMAERVIAGERLYVDVWDQNGPGIVAIHWLSTHLVGSSPVALRVFDALWQVLTLVALIGLAVRDGRRWLAGWLAAGLYVLSYYSMSYVHTGQREGFAILPLLLMLHLLYSNASEAHGAPDPSQCDSAKTVPGGWWRPFLAGALGLFIFMIKTPLGLAFGAMWLYLAAQAMQRRRAGPSVLVPLAGLTAGFMCAGGIAVALFMHMGSWDAFWGVLSRRDMPGYVLGPALIRSILPPLLAGCAGIGLLALVRQAGRRTFSSEFAGSTQERALVPGSRRWWVSAFFLFALLLSLRQWSEWRHVWTVFAGLWIPATGSILLSRWHERSGIWRLCLLMGVAVTGAVILQGQFFLYHLPPMLALAAYLAATEIADLLRWPTDSVTARSAWASVCVACTVYLIVGQWWPTMSFVTAHPYVLANHSLSDHYVSITKHKLSCPTYATTERAAERIRELTSENEPMASLFHEARLYYCARRPSVHKLIAMQSVYQHMFADYMQAIRDRKPKVVVARVPQHLRQSDDLQAVQTAVFDEAEAFFGPPGRAIRELYQATELIDDLCLLQPSGRARRPAAHRETPVPHPSM